MQFAILAFAATMAAAQTVTQLSPEQTARVIAGFESLTATRPDVKSVQSAVRSEVPKSYFTNDTIGPFYQSDLASLAEAPTPVFQTAEWFTMLDKPLQTAFEKLEPDALLVEESVISISLTPTTMAKVRRS